MNQGSNVVLLCSGRRVKNIVFTSGYGKNHEWRRPRVVFGESPTTENNVLFLYSWKGGNGFSTRMVPKLQITSGEATSDFVI
jgi:hypothetical protein